MNLSNSKKMVVINGDHLTDLESFYVEIDRVCTNGLHWKTGHNLNALHDILRGGFGVFDYEEPIILNWTNFEKSKKAMGDEQVGWVVEIISEHRHIEFHISK
jgi:RNAse (barnase) inhibitor barstar